MHYFFSFFSFPFVLLFPFCRFFPNIFSFSCFPAYMPLFSLLPFYSPPYTRCFQSNPWASKKPLPLTISQLCYSLNLCIPARKSIRSNALQSNSNTMRCNINQPNAKFSLFNRSFHSRIVLIRATISMFAFYKKKSVCFWQIFTWAKQWWHIVIRRIVSIQVILRISACFFSLYFMFLTDIVNLSVYKILVICCDDFKRTIATYLVQVNYVCHFVSCTTLST